MTDSNEHLYDHAPLAEALTDIAKALGITDADFYNYPDKARSFGWEAANRIQRLIEATGTDADAPTGDLTGDPILAGNPLDDPDVVAVFRLPIALSHLMSISNVTERIYGPNLVTQSYATPTLNRCFVIRRPEPIPDDLDRHADINPAAAKEDVNARS